MKKILFCVYGLGIGGIEKCLVNLVNALDPQRYNITVAVMNPEYDFRRQILPHVKIISFEEHFINSTDTFPLLKKNPFSFDKLAELTRYCAYRLALKANLSPWKLQRELPEHYDIAVAYTHVGHVPNFVLDRVQADQKLLWYHTLWTDRTNLSHYARFDGIVAVSQHCRQNFIECFPELSDKVSILYNLYDLHDIRSRSNAQPKEFSVGYRSIVTVGRLSAEKGCDLAVKACALLKQRFSDFRWYWVGDGPARKETEAAIRELGLEDSFLLLGARSNPYPYMAHCDIYAQVSYREAYCTTIIEAKSLHKPIIATQIGSVYEQLTPEYDGLICRIDPEDIARQIGRLLTDDALRSTLAANANANNFGIANTAQYDDYFL